MEGSTHPENTGVAEFPGGVRDPFAVDHHSPDANSNSHAQKRAHEDAAAEELMNEAKRIHVADDEDEDDADDLDLDALMAQLQQHAERAGSSEPAHASQAVSTYSEEATRKHEPAAEQLSQPGAQPPQADVSHHSGQEQQDESTRERPVPRHAAGEQAESEPQDASHELSIEQQLKGALSSFQDYGLIDHEHDSHDEDDFGLSQISAMLHQSDQAEQQRQEEQRQEHDQQEHDGKEKQGQHGQEQHAPAQKTVETGPHQDEASTDTTLREPPKPQEPRSTEAQDEADASKSGDAQGVDAQPQQATAAAPATAKHDGAKEDLAAKMPPLPASGGQLPPMPPPPPALTMPTAPLTAEERSHHLGRVSGDADLSQPAGEAARAEAPAPKPRTRLPEAPPPLSETYEKSLVEQVEEAQRADEQQPRAAILSENQAILQARRKSVAVLDSLAAQILEALGCNHYQETLATVTQPNSEKGLAYRLLLDAFEDAKRLFLMHASPSSRNGPEAKPDEVRPFLEPNIPGIELTRENTVTIQRANLATFVAAVFGTIEVGFWELDKWFVQAFVPEGGRLLKQQATIYLDLKTQAYISAVESTVDEDARKAAIDDLFPADLDQKLREMFGDRTMLAPSERDFVEKCKRRRENIEAEDAKDLSSKYHWVPFLRELSDYVQKNHYTLLPPRQKLIGGIESNSSVASSAQQAPIHIGASSARAAPARRTSTIPGPAAVAPAAANPPRPTQAARRTSSPRPAVPRPSQGPAAVTATSDSAPVLPHDADPKAEIQEVLAASRASNTEQQQLARPSSDASQGAAASQPAAPERAHLTEASAGSNHADAQREGAQQGDQAERPRAAAHDQPGPPPAGHPMFPPLPKQVLPPPGVLSGDRTTERVRRPGPRSAGDAPVVDGPTDTLAAYEAARASAEGTDAVRPRASMFTTRRTWTKEEEEALMKGMDRVQGPYWAQILELYGPGGKISEVLKDRSQVQLKDKARNLKMFFVRLGLPIPAVFQYVTGDYETRKSSGKRIRERKQRPMQGQSPTLASTGHPVPGTAAAPVAGPSMTTSVGDGTVTRAAVNAMSHEQPSQNSNPASGQSAPTSGHTAPQINGAGPQVPVQSQSSTQPQAQSSTQPQAQSSTQPQAQPQAQTQAQADLQRQPPSQSGSPHSVLPQQLDRQPAAAQESGATPASAPSESASEHAHDVVQEVSRDKLPVGDNSGKDLTGHESRDAAAAVATVQGGPQASSAQSGESKKAETSEGEIHVEVHRTEKASDFGDIFSEADDKEEDLNSLLTRVGELVDNH